MALTLEEDWTCRHTSKFGKASRLSRTTPQDLKTFATILQTNLEDSTYEQVIIIALLVLLAFLALLVLHCFIDELHCSSDVLCFIVLLAFLDLLDILALLFMSRHCMLAVWGWEWLAVDGSCLGRGGSKIQSISNQDPLQLRPWVTQDTHMIT